MFHVFINLFIFVEPADRVVPVTYGSVNRVWNLTLTDNFGGEHSIRSAAQWDYDAAPNPQSDAFLDWAEDALDAGQPQPARKRDPEDRYVSWCITLLVTDARQLFRFSGQLDLEVLIFETNQEIISTSPVLIRRFVGLKTTQH